MTSQNIEEIQKRQDTRNEVTRKQLGQEIALVDKIRKRRLEWFGHVTRMEAKQWRIQTFPYGGAQPCGEFAREVASLICFSVSHVNFFVGGYKSL